MKHQTTAASGQETQRATESLERRGGIQLWLQIAEHMRQAIVTGEFKEMMPPETVLAARFGVNRHTVRSALNALAKDGLVRAMQGRGTMILKRERLSYPIGRRTRFSDGLAGQVDSIRFALLGSSRVAAPREIAEALNLDAGAICPALETLGSADGVPLSRASHVFIPRLELMAETFGAMGSITLALRELGIPDYVRLSTEVTARHATAAEAAELALAPGAILLEIRAVNGLPDGTPIQHSRTLFPADKVKLDMRTEP